MPAAVLCPHGHRWEVADPTIQPLACPFCGALVVHGPADTGTLLQSPEDPANTLVQPDHEVGPSGTLFEGDRSPADLPGDPGYPEIPGYDFLGRLGIGGMGAVYKARHVPTDRVVALKVPHAAKSDVAARLRFATEAKAIARLQHPGIVQVFEVGETDDRVPYMALEFCPGGSLADRLDGTPRPPRPAAAVVEAVARAVGAAHAAGVVHRDLKPANILLQASGGRQPPESDTLGNAHSSSAGSRENAGSGGLRPPLAPICDHPKVSDFGLARRVDVDQGQTQTGAILGTPCYMAPEQAHGTPAGPAADVYAVGAILYELLTGHPPFRGATLMDTLDQVRNQEPVPPARLQPRLPRDLNTVCLKCLEKDPARRYRSAEELADDLRRFLDGRPVLAHPVGWVERLAKRARRNPLPTALLAALATAVLVGIGWNVRQQVRVAAERDRARGHFQMSLRAIDELLTEVADRDLAGEPRAEATRQALLVKALRFYQELLRVEVGDLSLEWEAARAARRVGDIHRLLGHPSDALAAYADADARLRSLPGDDAIRELALCHTFTGEVHRLAERRDEADAAYRRALDLLEPLHAAHPDHPDYRRDLAQCLYNRGIVAGTAGQYPAAREQFVRAAGLLDAVPVPTAEDHRHRARVCLNLADVLRLDQQPVEAAAAAEQGAGLLDRLAADHPDRPEYRHELAAALLNLAQARADAGRTIGDAIERGRRLLDELVRDFPATPGYRVELARACNTMAAVAFRAGDRPTAERLVRQAVGHWEALLVAQPGTAAFRGELGMALGNLGKACLPARPAEARELFERGIGEVLAGLRANPDEPSFRQALRRQARDLADLLMVASDHPAALRQAETIVAGLPGHPHGVQRAIGFLARCAAAVKGRPEADEYAKLAAELVRCGPADEAVLRADPDIEPLRAHPAFMAAVK